MKTLSNKGLPTRVHHHQRTAIATMVSGLLVSSTAMAQTAGQVAPAQTKDPATLEEIIVTAQGRQQNILEVPYNISAVSGDTIEQSHYLDAAELMRNVPGISVVDRGARNSSVVNGIRIRGLNVDSSALGDYAVGAAATVATYVNSTPLFANFLLDDIDRVEVLRGPQGTLYGSGALGGAVRYLLRDPDLSKFSGRATASASSVDHSGSVGYSGGGMLNIPLASTLALRINGTANHYPGVTDYVQIYQLDGNGTPIAPNGILDPAAAYTSRKDADYAHQGYVRAALLWKPSDSFSANLSYTSESDHYGGRRATSLGTDGNGRPYQDAEVGSVQLEPSNRNVHLTALEANIDLGFATLTSSTSHYNHFGDIVSENTGFYAQNGWLGAFYYNYPRPMASAVRTYGDRAFIQELRLVSNTSTTIDYVVGAYYQNQHQTSSQDSYLRGFKQWWDAFAPGAASAVISDQDYLYRHSEQFKDVAGYGELTWHVSPTLSLTGGLRSFHDSSQTAVHQNTGLYSSIFASSDSNGSQGESHTLFKGNVAWTYARDQQLYATVAQGYRRGGSNGIPVTGNFQENPAWQNYRSDSDVDYEVGLKGMRDGITYNADVFYIDWRHPQLNAATTNWGFFAVQNAESASTKGLELELDGRVHKQFHYGAGATYTNARLTADAISADKAYTINTSGARLPGAPVLSFNATADYTLDLGNGKLTLRADAYHQTSTEDTLFSSQVSINAVATSAYLGQPKFAYSMPGFSIVNASTTYAQGVWDGTFWIKNVFNSPGVTGVYTPAYMGTAPAQGYYGNGSKALIALPRTVGVTLAYRF